MPLVTDPTPPPMTPPLDAVEEVPADDELSSKRNVGVKACLKLNGQRVILSRCCDCVSTHLRVHSGCTVLSLSNETSGLQTLRRVWNKKALESSRTTLAVQLLTCVPPVIATRLSKVKYYRAKNVQTHDENQLESQLTQV